MMIRSFRIVSIAILSVVPAVAAQQIQQRGASQNQRTSPPTFSSIADEESFKNGAGIPSRRVQTRTEVNGREVVAETTEAKDMDGRFRIASETTTETVRTPAGATIKRDTFIADAEGRRTLSETTQTDVQTQKDGSGRSVSNTFKPDLNGKLTFSIQQVQ